MLKVLFFAQIREVLKCDSIEFETTAASLADLRRELSTKSELWSQTLNTHAALAAVNQTIAADDVTLKDGDEVAFFPPVTGG